MRRTHLHARSRTHAHAEDTLTFVIGDTFGGAVPSYPRLGKIIVNGSLLRRRVGLLHVVARDREGGPRGGVLGQPEVRRLVARVARHGTGGRLLGRVLVAIADLAGPDAPARAVPAELAASETEK